MMVGIAAGALIACDPATAPPGITPDHPATAESSESARVLPFIENDYAAALSAARARKTPLFVEVWAPW
jgi:hypothetical protein